MAEYIREVEQRKSKFPASVSKNEGRTRAKVLVDLRSLVVNIAWRSGMRKSLSHRPPGCSPLTNGISATLPLSTRNCGLSVRKTPSTLGFQTSLSVYRVLATLSKGHKNKPTWNEKIFGLLFIADCSLLADTLRKQSRVLFAPVQPVS